MSMNDDVHDCVRFMVLLRANNAVLVSVTVWLRTNPDAVSNIVLDVEDS